MPHPLLNNRDGRAYVDIPLACPPGEGLGSSTQAFILAFIKDQLSLSDPPVIVLGTLVLVGSSPWKKRVRTVKVAA